MAGKKERSGEEIENALQEAWLTVPEDIKDDYLFVGVAIKKSNDQATLVVQADDGEVEDDMLGKIQRILLRMAGMVPSVSHTVRVRDDLGSS